MLLLVVVVVPFIVPACIVGHWLGLMPSLGQLHDVVFGSGNFFHPSPYTGKWLSRRYPDILVRFILIDLVFVLLTVIAWRLVRAMNPSKDAQPLGWMVRYDCVDGSRVISNDRYPTPGAAQEVARKIKSATVGTEQRQVVAWLVALDPALDTRLVKRKRQQARDTNKTHAYCGNCHRRIYAGDVDCICGIHRNDNWETQFAAKTGLTPESPPAGAEKLTPTPVH